MNEGYQDPAKPDGPRLWFAQFTGETGVQVHLVQLEAVSLPGTGASPPPMPLTPEQMIVVALSDTWKSVLSAIAVPPSLPVPPAIPAMPQSQMIAAIKALAPQGLRFADEEGEDGYVALTVDDGRGKVLITVNVQRWNRNDPHISEVFKGAITSRDGTLFITRRDPVPGGGKGAIQWTADTLRTDGLRVVITELNAPAFVLPAERNDLPVSIERLTSMALDPEWRTQ